MSDEEVAKKFVAELIDDLDVGGGNYSPDLRDSLSDEQEWLVTKLTGLLNRVLPA
jgi:hypothetical protein